MGEKQTFLLLILLCDQLILSRGILGKSTINDLSSSFVGRWFEVIVDEVVFCCEYEIFIMLMRKIQSKILCMNCFVGVENNNIL